MLNLIRKDFIIQKNQIFLFIPFIIFFAIFGNHMSPFFILFLAATYIPINAYIYDAQVESNILLNSLPYTRKKIVASRYVGAIFYMIISLSIASLILWLFNFQFGFRDIFISIGLFLLFTAIAFPLFYILKPSYIGIASFIGVIIIAVIMRPLISFTQEHLTSVANFISNLSTTTIYSGAAIILFSLFIMSWFVSQSIYERKEF